MNIKPVLLAASLAVASTGAQSAAVVSNDTDLLVFTDTNIEMTSQTRAERRAERRAARQAARAERRAARRAARQGAATTGPVQGRPTQAQIDALIAANFPDGLGAGSRVRVRDGGLSVVVRNGQQTGFGQQPSIIFIPFN